MKVAASVVGFEPLAFAFFSSAASDFCVLQSTIWTCCIFKRRSLECLTRLLPQCHNVLSLL